MGGKHLRYLAGWPDDQTFDLIIDAAAKEVGLDTLHLPDGVRVRDTATHRFVFNYAPAPRDWNGITIAPAGVHWEPLS